MSVVVIGLNHRTVPLDLLERLTVDGERLPKVLDDLVSRDHVSEAVLLSTCNRTEVYIVAERFHGAYEDVRDFLCDLGHLRPEEFAHHLYVHYDLEAVRHLFSVASGLDSAVVGENEILGQVRTAWDESRLSGAAGPSLNDVFRRALETGKRARTETGISRHTTSVSQAAVAMAREHLGDLSGRRAVVLGAGEMGRGVVAALAEEGLADLAVANRTWERSLEVAAEADGRAVRLGELPEVLAEADLLLTSTGATALIVEHADIEPVATGRAGRPLLIIDIAVPRDVDPGVGELPGVTLLDMDDLVAFTEAGIRERLAEVSAVSQIVAEEVERHTQAGLAREVAPLVTALHSRAEEIRDAELERVASKLDAMDPADRKLVETLLSRVVGKLLHEPTTQLKGAAGSPRGERLAEAARDLFRLDT